MPTRLPHACKGLQSCADAWTMLFQAGGGEGWGKASTVPHLYFGSICAANYTPMFCLLLLVQLALSFKNHLPCCLVIIATCRLSAQP